MPIVHGFDPPERFVAGTVGEPGARTFFLQARSGPKITSVSLEKQQVAALAERMDELLDEVMSGGTESVVPAVAPVGLVDAEPLEQPIEEEFRAGTMTLAWEADAERVVIEVFAVITTEQVDVEETDPVTAAMESEDAEVFIVRISEEQARAFARRAVALVASGRPSCPFCGRPIDPEGHICPRANGYRRHVRE